MRSNTRVVQEERQAFQFVFAAPMPGLAFSPYLPSTSSQPAATSLAPLHSASLKSKTKTTDGTFNVLHKLCGVNWPCFARLSLNKIHGQVNRSVCVYICVCVRGCVCLVHPTRHPMTHTVSVFHGAVTKTHTPSHTCARGVT